MKALQFYGKEEYELCEKIKPEIGEDGVLLKVKAAAICGSDLRMIANGSPGVSKEHPVIYGHEFAGTIEETGKQVKGFEPGMRVAVAPNMGCGICDDCVGGNTHLCAGYRALGIHENGGFAEYVAIPGDAVRQGNLVQIGDRLSFEEAAVIEPLSCVYNGFEQVGIKPCDTVLIIGAGPIGIMHGMLAKMAGASRIILSDLNENRAGIAKAFDPFFVTYSGKNLKQFIMDQTNGQGVSVCITACPSPQAQADALDLMKTNGRINFFGGLPAGSSNVTIDTNQIHYKQLILTGSCRSSLRQYRTCIRLAEEGILDLKKLVSALYRLEQFEEAFLSAKEGRNLKNIFIFD